MNLVLDKGDIPLHCCSAEVILRQEAIKPPPGCPLDNALEGGIAGSFYKAYIESIPSADSLEKMSPEELATLRKNRSFDAVGVAAHTLFSAGKQFTYNLLNPELNKYYQHVAHEKNHTERKFHHENNQDVLAHVPRYSISDLLKGSFANASSLDETVKTIIENFNALKTNLVTLITEEKKKDLNAGTTNPPCTRNNSKDI